MRYVPVMKVLQRLEKLERDVLGFGFAEAMVSGIRGGDVREEVAASAELQEDVASVEKGKDVSRQVKIAQSKCQT